MLYCNFCGYAQEHSLVEHINSEHDGLAAYFTQYPGQKIVSLDVMQQLCNPEPKDSPATKPAPQEPVAACLTLSSRKKLSLPSKSGGDLVPEVDPDYHFPDEAIDAVYALENNLNLYLTGPTGTGKSSLVTQLAARMNWPVQRVNLNNQFSVSDLVGRWIVEGKAMKYSYGVLPLAMMKGQILLLDELTAVDPGILLTLQAVLEGNALVLTDKDGEVITRHPDFRIVATDNTKGSDAGMNSLYQGRMNQDASLLDRFQVMLEIDYLPTKVEAKMLQKKTGITEKMAIAITALSGKVRKAVKNEELFCTFSTRQSLAFAHYLAKTKDVERAAKVTILNRLDVESRKVVSDMINLVIPQKEK